MISDRGAMDPSSCKVHHGSKALSIRLLKPKNKCYKPNLMFCSGSLNFTTHSGHRIKYSVNDMGTPYSSASKKMHCLY